MTPKKEKTKVDYCRRVKLVQEYIAHHLAEPLSPVELSQVANLSLHHFHRVFRGVTGESIGEYVRRLKLERAARRLRVTNQKIIDIAFDAGYSSHEGFTRAFREYFGVAPSEFRGQLPIYLGSPISPPDRVEIRHIHPISVAQIRHVGAYGESGQVFSSLLSWAVSANINLAQARMFGLCADDPDITPVNHLRFDACIEYHGSGDVLRGITTGYIPGGKYAIATHIGPYNTILDTYLALIGGWIPQTSYELHDEAVVEFYLDDPNQTPPERLRTELWIRLRLPSD
jgi:AraC family transcriptional regulator